MPEYGLIAQYARVHPQPAEIPPELAAEVERIEQRLGELEDVSERCAACGGSRKQ